MDNFSFYKFFSTIAIILLVNIYLANLKSRPFLFLTFQLRIAYTLLEE